MQKIIPAFIVIVVIIASLIMQYPITIGQQNSSSYGVPLEAVEEYSAVNLSDLKGKEFKVFYIHREGEVVDRLNQILYLVSDDPSSIAGHLELVGTRELGPEKIYVFHGVYSGKDVVVALGDMGSFLIRIGDGRTGSYMSYYMTYNYINIIKKTMTVSTRYSIKYAGQYGERTAYERIGYICNVSGGTTTCTVPANQSVQKILYNPYEVYYIYIDGYRVEPPIRVRCCVPEYNSGLRAVYVEGFIPWLTSRVDVFRVDEAYLNKIVSLAKQAGMNVKSYDDLIIEDMYLHRGNGTLSPIILLRKDYTLFWVELGKDGPIPGPSAGLLDSGRFSSGNEDKGIRIDWESILSSTEAVSTNSTSSKEPHTPLVLVLTIFITLVSVAFLTGYYLGYKRQGSKL
ncbi:hypothetical protein [Staphylothermus hellenicus]|uniref:Uncharacterized protein n=1 Tax=Staphylothermus hellenicus (strain DSM 12710 / JCM 10830 / BK20S6-10-b1 / P8) TaxID=591019 RepID=D7DB87_STAHD|nr:hypothetical protein [Staphylothermus hellenicus]ADI31434.1 hypothetical protein Shell_0299 [Staphylothermus hellenicus DSM 12710]